MTPPLPPTPAAASARKAPLPARPKKALAPPASVDSDLAANRRMLRVLTMQTIIMSILAGVLLVFLPFVQPIYQYFALNPKREVMQLVPLTMPNMTNQAVLSWATTSVTEIMTIGFGDYKEKILSQRPRFTSDGWDAFRSAFDKQKIGETFKRQQLVLTTVPSDTPVIVAQGVNPKKHIYEWRVQMPVIMTYATNNNVTQRDKSIIELTIVRVSPEQNPFGIGIANWTLKT